MLNPLARAGFERMLRFGCFCRFLPYRWNPHSSQLLSPSPTDLNIFKFHKALIYIYTTYMIVRTIQASIFEEYFPLQQRLLSSLWVCGFSITSVGFLQLQLCRVEIMSYGNGLLNKTGAGALDLRDTTRYSSIVDKIQEKDSRTLSIHLYIAIFLLLTNPYTHTLITYQSPCSPHFISSLIFWCDSIAETGQSVEAKIPILLFELYVICMFLYICSFHWSFILFGLSLVSTELTKMEQAK